MLFGKFRMFIVNLFTVFSDYRFIAEYNAMSNCCDIDLKPLKPLQHYVYPVIDQF